jgi:hypothetical protein
MVRNRKRELTAFSLFGERKVMTFDPREDNLEKEFVHDEELRFRATARRNNLLGLWIADKLGLSGASANEYAHNFVKWSISVPNEADAIKNILYILQSSGVTQSDHQVQRMMDQLMGEAITQLATDATTKAGK